MVGNLYECEYGWRVSYPDRLILGKNTDIGTYSYIGAHEGVEIQDDVQIGGGSFIYSYNSINNVRGKVLIKEGARIGAQCVILPGVTIEAGEFVKAKSVVKKSKIADEIIILSAK